MRLLLDTHVALWAVTDDPRLSQKARALIVDLYNEVFVSAASLWEVAIKHALARGGPNDMPVSGQEALRYFRQAGNVLLDITAAQVVAVETLPRLILVAQALATPLRLLTHVSRVVRYSDTIIAV